VSTCGGSTTFINDSNRNIITSSLQQNPFYHNNNKQTINIYNNNNIVNNIHHNQNHQNHQQSSHHTNISQEVLNDINNSITSALTGYIKEENVDICIDFNDSDDIDDTNGNVIQGVENVQVIREGQVDFLKVTQQLKPSTTTAATTSSSGTNNHEKDNNDDENNESVMKQQQKIFFESLHHSSPLYRIGILSEDAPSQSPYELMSYEDNNNYPNNNNKRKGYIHMIASRIPSIPPPLSSSSIAIYTV